MTCVVCDSRPAVPGTGYCHNCAQKLEAEKRKAKAQQPVKFATYRGHVVGFYPNGEGTLTPRLLRRKAESLPKNKTLDLNTYIEGFTREQVKKIKSTILQLAEC
jgi:hypothetical protein